jgi:hypothetical protein
LSTNLLTASKEPEGVRYIWARSTILSAATGLDRPRACRVRRVMLLPHGGAEEQALHRCLRNGLTVRIGAV